MVPFAGLLAALDQIPDPRRRQGQRYRLAFLLLFSVLAVLAGATSYRRIRLFIGCTASGSTPPSAPASVAPRPSTRCAPYCTRSTRPRSRPLFAVMPSILVTPPL